MIRSRTPPSWRHATSGTSSPFAARTHARRVLAISCTANRWRPSERPALDEAAAGIALGATSRPRRGRSSDGSAAMDRELWGWRHPPEGHREGSRPMDARRHEQPSRSSEPSDHRLLAVIGPRATGPAPAERIRSSRASGQPRHPAGLVPLCLSSGTSPADRLASFSLISPLPRWIHGLENHITMSFSVTRPAAAPRRRATPSMQPSLLTA